MMWIVMMVHGKAVAKRVKFATAKDALTAGKASVWCDRRLAQCVADGINKRGRD